MCVQASQGIPTTASDEAGSVIDAGERFDVVVANILAGPLIQLAPCLAKHCQPGGSITLSGILAGQQAHALSRPSSLP